MKYEIDKGWNEYMYLTHVMMNFGFMTWMERRMLLRRIGEELRMNQYG